MASTAGTKPHTGFLQL